VNLERVQQGVRGIPFMSPHQGSVVYRHIRETRPELVLEIGTAHGVSAAYMAAALAENGSGHVVTVDRADAPFEPVPLLEKLGLAERVTFVRREDSSYNWFLKEQIAEQSDEAGNCEPLYDFCYLDAAKNWTIDGLAVFLIEKLLRPGAWLLLDDLEWSYAASPGRAPEPFPLSDSERREPNLRAVFDLLVRQHPNFTEFRVQDGNWGWAHKSPGSPRRYEVETSRSLTGMLAVGAWKVARTLTARRGSR
jgi:predicted O-methyltransferase YrrM